MKKELYIYGGFVVLSVFFIVTIILILKKNSSVYDDDVVDDDLSADESDYYSWADAIFNACNGIGTDEETIYRVLRYLETKSDWNKLVTVYGTDADNFNLPGRLIYELTNSEQTKVNNILSRIGVRL